MMPYTGPFQLTRMPPPMDAAGAFALRVRRLPGALSPDAVGVLLSHYGAAHVLPERRLNDVSSGREPGSDRRERTQSAIARFSSKDAQQRALQRLQGLELAGNVLEVALVEASEPTKVGQDAATRTRAGNLQPPLPKGDPPPLPPLPPPANVPAGVGNDAMSAAYAPAPLAPHLGLHFAPSPLLEYKYPRATEEIVRNIANGPSMRFTFRYRFATIFYTQVLHLMNKMNLPLPFEENAIPGVFSADRADRKRPRPAEPPASPQFIEEEEDENEEDESKTTEAVSSSEAPSTARKRPRVSDGSHTNAISADATGTQPRRVIPERSQRLPLKRQQSRSSRVVGDSAQLSRAFQIADSSKQKHAAPRPGVITEAEVRRRRRPSLDMAADPSMQNYSRGAPSSTIRVQNLAEAVDEGDLRSIFAFVLPPELDVMSIAVNVSTSDRSATVAYPTEELAAAAIDQLHGVVLEGHSLVVSFHSDVNSSQARSRQERVSADSLPLQASSIAWTVESLDASRLGLTDLSTEKAMKNYTRGDRSSTLYVKNLAKSVQLDDLKLLFAATLPPNVSADDMNIRYFTEGRMKCQAFVAFPTEEMAERALDKAHGVVLQGKPLVVCFRKQPSSSTSTATKAQQ